MNEIIEQWKPIEGYRKYEVSNHGRVRVLRANGEYKIRNYGVDSSGYGNVGLAGKTKTIHRLVAKAFLDDWNPNLEVDHINGDKLDNAVWNLRMATRADNSRAYRKPYSGSESRFRGVSLHKQGKYEYWRARIRYNGKLISLGYFKKERDAALAYNSKAMKLDLPLEALNPV